MGSMQLFSRGNECWSDEMAQFRPNSKYSPITSKFLQIQKIVFSFTKQKAMNAVKQSNQHEASRDKSVEARHFFWFCNAFSTTIHGIAVQKSLLIPKMESAILASLSVQSCGFLDTVIHMKFLIGTAYDLCRRIALTLRLTFVWAFAKPKRRSPTHLAGDRRWRQCSVSV